MEDERELKTRAWDGKKTSRKGEGEGRREVKDRGGKERGRREGDVVYVSEVKCG